MFSDLPWYGKALCLAAFFGAISPSSAAAEWLDGNKLHDQCVEHTLHGLGYMKGAVDAIVMNVDGFCIPPNVTGRQLSDVICQDLRENPKDRDKPAAFLVFMSLKRAWSCK
jgi:hypothetical protein